MKVTWKEKTYEVDSFSTPLDMIKAHQLQIVEPMAAVINGHLGPINAPFRGDSTLDVIEGASYLGRRIYESSVLFLFVVAFTRKFPNLNVFIQHSISSGVFAEIKECELSETQVFELENEMKQLVHQKMPIGVMTRDWDAAMERMKETNRTDLVKMFRFHRSTEIELVELEGIEECLYLPVLPNSQFIKDFRLKKYQDGIAIILPSYESGEKKLPEMKHQPKLFATYKEYHEWSRIVKVRTVGQLNRYIMNGEIDDLIKVSEALHEKKVGRIADEIAQRDYVPRIVLIAGPSSSGKTTFSKRLAVQLRVNGFRPVAISMDNYFLEREKTPKDKDGNYDFESLNAIDVPLFSQHVNDLLLGKEVDIPEFNFKTGTRKFGVNKFHLEEDQIIIVEGIHGINPKLTENIDPKHKFKIYISALTQLNLHRHDRVPTTDTRLIRRIVRDSLYRGYSGGDTLNQWRHVRKGETLNIFPYQEDVDVIFNSAMFYELSVLKTRAERELLRVERTHPMYAEAQRLLKFLSFFLPLEADGVPNTSLLREFVGGSSFEY